MVWNQYFMDVDDWGVSDNTNRYPFVTAVPRLHLSFTMGKHAKMPPKAFVILIFLQDGTIYAGTGWWAMPAHSIWLVGLRRKACPSEQECVVAVPLMPCAGLWGVGWNGAPNLRLVGYCRCPYPAALAIEL